MHVIHHTRAFVLTIQPIREHDAMIGLFTEEFGLVVAIATGIRKAGAKLTSQVIEYSFIDVDLVRGKDIWRLISATCLEYPLQGITRHPYARSYVRILLTIKRFLVDEGAHVNLFLKLIEVLKCMQTRKEDAKRFETVVIWNILKILGYIADDSEFDIYATMSLSEALSRIEDSEVMSLITIVNKAIKETHL